MFKQGQVVMCNTSHYASIDRGSAALVLEIRKYRGTATENIGKQVIRVRHDRGSAYRESVYFAENFTAATERQAGQFHSRNNTWAYGTFGAEEKDECSVPLKVTGQPRLFIAMLVPEGVTASQFSDSVAELGWYDSADTQIMVASDEDAMRLKVANRITDNPDETWIVMGAKMVAQAMPFRVRMAPL